MTRARRALLALCATLAVSVFAAGGFASAASATTLTIGASLACQLADGVDTTSYCDDGEPAVQVGELCADACQWYRVLAKFDLDGALPANAVITSASLGPDTVTAGVDTHQMLTAWDGSADWFTSDGSTAWPNGDGALGDASGPLGTNVTSLVQDWFSGAVDNDGFLYTLDLSAWGTWVPLTPDLTITYTV